ncbi:ketopantoate reductase-like protein [Amylocystis lapponica]|nr:ketopantoate reductase-like protein [Amylocystis lapponica]
MRIHIVGFGAIGTLTSFYLRNSLDPKHALVILHKNAARVAAAVSAGGIVKLEAAGVTRSASGFVHQSFDAYDDIAYRRAEDRRLARLAGKPPPPFYAGPTLPESETHIESLIVSTKANFVVPVLTNFLPRLSSSSTIVLLHNGMGVYEDLLRKVFRNPEQRPHIVVTCNTHGAYVRDYAHAVHNGVGDLQLGIMPEPHGRDFEAGARADAPHFAQQRQLRLDDITPVAGDPHAARYLSLRNTLAALTAAEGLGAAWRPIYDVQMAMRRKLVVNAIVNPLTALLGCRNGDLLKHPAGMRIAERLCREAEAIFRAQWRAEAGGPTSDEARGAFSDVRFPDALLADKLFAECKRVVRLTQANTSSMVVDVMRERDTEIGVLCGHLLSLARTYNVRAPLMATMQDLILLRSNVPLDRALPWTNVS